MAYVMARIYSSSGTMGAEQLAQLALKDLAPKLAEGGGLTRYVTIVFSDGRRGSFSAYESQDAAKRGQQIAAELVKGHKDFQNLKLDETMEGEVIYAAQGSVPMTGRLHGLAGLHDECLGRRREGCVRKRGRRDYTVLPGACPLHSGEAD